MGSGIIVPGASRILAPAEHGEDPRALRERMRAACGARGLLPIPAATMPFSHRAAPEGGGGIGVAQEPLRRGSASSPQEIELLMTARGRRGEEARAKVRDELEARGMTTEEAAETIRAAEREANATRRTRAAAQLHGLQVQHGREVADAAAAALDAADAAEAATRRARAGVLVSTLDAAWGKEAAEAAGAVLELAEREAEGRREAARRLLGDHEAGCNQAIAAAAEAAMDAAERERGASRRDRVQRLLEEQEMQHRHAVERLVQEMSGVTASQETSALGRLRMQEEAHASAVARVAAEMEAAQAMLQAVEAERADMEASSRLDLGREWAALDAERRDVEVRSAALAGDRARVAALDDERRSFERDKGRAWEEAAKELSEAVRERAVLAEARRALEAEKAAVEETRTAIQVDREAVDKAVAEVAAEKARLASDVAAFEDMRSRDGMLHQLALLQGGVRDIDAYRARVRPGARWPCRKP